MSDKFKETSKFHPDDVEDAATGGHHGDRSPSSLSVASAQSMKWDSTADFLEYSHHPIVGGTTLTTTSHQVVLPSTSQRCESNQDYRDYDPQLPDLSTFEGETGEGRNKSPDSSSSVSQTKTYTLPGQSTATQSPAPSPSFPSSPIPVQRKDVGVSVSLGAPVDVKKISRDFVQQCNLDSFKGERRKEVDRVRGDSRRDAGKSGGTKYSKTRKDRRNCHERTSPDSAPGENTDNGGMTSGAISGLPLGRSVSDASTDWEYGQKRFVWQTLGMTRSEVEYQNKKNSSTSINTDEVSLLKLNVASYPDVRNENRPGMDRKKQKGSDRNNDTYKEVRELDYKFRGILNRISSNTQRERSGGFEASSSSGASTLCKNARDYATLLEKYLSKDRMDSPVADDLQERIHYHLRKIKEQIRLVERYNRALLERELKRSSCPKRRVMHMPGITRKDYSRTSPFQSKNPRCRGNDFFEARKQDKLQHSDHSEGSDSENSSYKRRRSKRPNKNSTTRSRDERPKHRVHRVPTPDSVSSDEERLKCYSNFDTQLPVTIAYERWTWPRDHQAPTDAHRMRRRKDIGGQHKDNDQEHRGANESRRSHRRNHDEREITREDKLKLGRDENVNRETLRIKTKISETPQKKVPALKSVAFFVPLFCDNCNEPVEAENKKGTCYNCQHKYSWFCENKGEDGLYDVKGPQEIQECFKDAPCSETVVKRNEELLESKFERMTDDDKICEGLIAKRLSRKESEAFLRNQCQFKVEEVQRVLNYMDQYFKRQDYWATQKSRKTVIPEREMRERTARLRANDHVIAERRRKEQEESRRNTNRIMQRIYAKEVRNRNLKEGQSGADSRRR